LSFGRKEAENFLGRDFVQQQEYSENTAIRIDDEVGKIVKRNYERARKILSDHIQDLHRLAGSLLEFESLDGDQLDQILQGKTLKPPEKSTPGPRVEVKGVPPSQEPIPGLTSPLPEPGKA
jgi:cell division protease FtsH